MIGIARIGFQHGDMRRGAALRDHEIGNAFARLPLRHQIAAQIVRIGDGRGKADGLQTRCEPKQPRQTERQQIAALGSHQRVQFVEHDALQRAEQIRRVGGGQQQRKLFGRGEQDIGRIAALARAFRQRRVAGAGLDPDRQSHFRNRRSRGCARCRRRAPSAAKCKACAGPASGEGRGRSRPACETSRCVRSIQQASAGIPPASCRRRSARSATPNVRRAHASADRADARAASSRARQTSAQTPPAAGREARWA